jgi:uncharacterized protein YbjT (DUF2867 family)
MKILLFGATGTAGGGVLTACLSSSAVEEVRAVVRRPLSRANGKLRPVVHADYLDYTPVEGELAGVDACFFCLGKSATQVSGEAEYRQITYDFALAAVRALRARSPGAVFHYLSGQGAGLDSRMMWARVKAEAERDLIAGFGAVCWRPAAIDGEVSESAPGAYRYLRPLYLLLRPFRGLYVRAEDIGKAMLQATRDGTRGRIFENAEIRDLADRARA